MKPWHSNSSLPRILDTIHLAFIVDGLYFYLITSFGDSRVFLAPTWYIALHYRWLRRWNLVGQFWRRSILLQVELHFVWFSCWRRFAYVEHQHPDGTRVRTLLNTWWCAHVLPLFQILCEESLCVMRPKKGHGYCTLNNYCKQMTDRELFQLKFCRRYCLFVSSVCTQNHGHYIIC